MMSEKKKKYGGKVFKFMLARILRTRCYKLSLTRLTQPLLKKKSSKARNCFPNIKLKKRMRNGVYCLCYVLVYNTCEYRHFDHHHHHHRHVSHLFKFAGSFSLLQLNSNENVVYDVAGPHQNEDPLTL